MLKRSSVNEEQNGIGNYCRFARRVGKMGKSNTIIGRKKIEYFFTLWEAKAVDSRFSSCFRFSGGCCILGWEKW
jgi:hypothetical protein